MGLISELYNIECKDRYFTVVIPIRKRDGILIVLLVHPIKLAVSGVHETSVYYKQVRTVSGRRIGMT